MSMRRLGPRSLTCLASHHQAPTTKYHSQHRTRESTWSQQPTCGVSNAAPHQTPPEIAASPSPPSFMRDTALVHAAMQMSDLRLYATSEQPRNNDDPWSPVPTSPQAQHGNGGVTTLSRPEHHSSMSHPVRDSNGGDVSYASNSSSNFGLSPHDLFNRAHNEGQYHE